MAAPHGAAAALALWVGLIEVAQMWIVGRTSDITPPILMLGLALVFERLKRAESHGRLAGAGSDDPDDRTSFTGARRM